MKICWNRPFNCLEIWFDRRNLRRCSIGWGDVRDDNVNWTFWWAVFGFSGGIIWQPWINRRRHHP